MLIRNLPGQGSALRIHKGNSFKPHSPETSPLSHGFLWRMQLLTEVVEPLQILLIFQKFLCYSQVSSFHCPPTAYLLPSPPVWFPHCSASKVYLWVWGWGGKICTYTLPMCGTVSTCSLCALLSQRDLLLQPACPRCWLTTSKAENLPDHAPPWQVLAKKTPPAKHCHALMSTHCHMYQCELSWPVSCAALHIMSFHPPY